VDHCASHGVLQIAGWAIQCSHPLPGQASVSVLGNRFIYGTSRTGMRHAII
jgi:hypothetical protein